MSGTAVSTSSTRVFLCVDIDSSNSGREAWQRGLDFVDSCDLKYGLSSKDIASLGGAERARLPELYDNDWEWSQKGPAVFKEPTERIEIELFDSACPLAVKNFISLCVGDKGVSKQSGKPIHYKGVPIHRIVRGFVAQGGDFVTGTGAGGESVYGKKFKDDPAGLKLKHDRRGLVSMCNTGKNSNTCQFFITLGAAKQLDGKHVVFGRVVAGMEVLDRMEELAAPPDSADDKPRVPVVIADCGLVPETAG